MRLNSPLKAPAKPTLLYLTPRANLLSLAKSYGVRFVINGASVHASPPKGKENDPGMKAQVAELQMAMSLQVRSTLEPDVPIPYQSVVPEGVLVVSRFILEPVKLADGSGLNWAVERAREYRVRTGADQLTCETLAAVDLICWWNGFDGPAEFKWEIAFLFSINTFVGADNILGDQKPLESEHQLGEDCEQNLFAYLNPEWRAMLTEERERLLAIGRQAFDSLRKTKGKPQSDRHKGFGSLVKDKDLMIAWT